MLQVLKICITSCVQLLFEVYTEQCIIRFQEFKNMKCIRLNQEQLPYRAI